MKNLVYIFDIVIGLGLAGVWINDIRRGLFKGRFFQWRDGDNLMWPHVAVEMLTAAMLFLSGVGSLLKLGWAEVLTFFSMGAIFYASFNSLGWTLAKRGRWPYSTIMIFGLIGSLVYMTVAIMQLAGAF